MSINEPSKIAQDLNFWQLIRNRELTPLLRLRWAGQFTDGLFQSALASFVLFSPERQANAMAAATAFAVVLLPYSIIGPFVGTLLDRFSRQRAIALSNALRSLTLILIAALVFRGETGVTLTIFVLIAFGVNRLILAGLSAGLPLVAPRQALIASNALAVTGGSVCVVLGGGLGLLLRRISDSLFASDYADGVLLLAASFGYAIASTLAFTIKVGLGPLPHQIKKANFSQGVIEMREGWGFLKLHPDAARGIFAVAINRGGITALTLIALLLERNTFNNPADSDAGLAGLSVALSCAAIGFTLGAFIAPVGVNHMGRHRWMRLSLALAAAGSAMLIFDRTQILLCIAAFITGLFGQSVKVTNDALVQSKISDEYRGRVFAVYDVVVNGFIVTYALIAAALMPLSGDSSIVPLLVAGTYLLVALIALRPTKFFVRNENSTTS